MSYLKDGSRTRIENYRTPEDNFSKLVEIDLKQKQEIEYLMNQINGYILPEINAEYVKYLLA